MVARGCSVMLTLVTSVPGLTIATSSLPCAERTGVLICLLATVVIVVELRRPRNHDIHAPALISNCHIACSS